MYVIDWLINKLGFDFWVGVLSSKGTNNETIFDISVRNDLHNADDAGIWKRCDDKDANRRSRVQKL